MPDDLNAMAVFVAVAETKRFRVAGERISVSGSAVSQTLRRLEERLGMALVQRTTRSVRLTEAGSGSTQPRGRRSRSFGLPLPR